MTANQTAIIPTVVIDTSVLTVLLHNDDPTAEPLAQRWRQGRIRPLSTPKAEDHLGYALLHYSPSPRAYPAYQFLNKRLAIYQRYRRLFTRIPPDCPPKSSSPRNQQFINLAEYTAADYLITRDNDLLVLNSQTPFLILTDQDFLNLIYGATQQP